MLTRAYLKRKSAELLNSLSGDTLFEKFQITRVGEITGLDCVGVPVWAATRPCAKVISVTAGKSLDSRMARAGAIAEAIEYSTFERDVEAPYECLTRFNDGSSVPYPGEMVWLGNLKEKTSLSQRTSNGQAVAGTFDEAFLAGLYECIERDSITIRTCALQEYGRIPPKHRLEDLEGNLAVLRDRIVESGLTLFLFACSFDIRLPVYWAIVIDPSGDFAPFGGWGCHLDSRVAAERAMLEALQSRLVYISGARDDIQRRNFDLLRNQDPSYLIRAYKSVPSVDTLDSKIGDNPIDYEKQVALSRLGPWKDKILYKHIELPFGLHAVKVFVPGLEGPITPMWKPSRWLEVKKYYEEHNLRRPDTLRCASGEEERRDVATAGGAR